jgi:ATP-binding cassette, subfamily B, bacterial
MRILLRTVPYLRGHVLAAVAVLVVTVLTVIAQLLIPWAMKVVVDNVLGRAPLGPLLEDVVPTQVAADPTALLVFAALGGFLLTVAAYSLTVLNTYLQTRVDQGMVLQFRSQLYRHVQRLSLSRHDQRSVSETVHQINYSAPSLGQVPVMVPHILQALVTLLGMFLITYSIDSTMAFLALAVVPILFLALRYYSGAVQPRLERVRNREIESLSIVQETLSMLRVVVAFGREDYEHGRFREHGERTVDARVSVTISQTLFAFAIDVTIAGGTALVLGFGANQVMQGSLTLGQLLVILAYIASVYAPLSQLVGAATPMQQQVVDLRAAFSLLDESPEVVDLPGGAELGRVRGHVHFESVSYAYGGRSAAVRDISFETEPGDVTAIVGPTGAGKTTLVSLLMRFYDPASGRIALDGRDIREAAVRSLRDQFSVVLQDTPLFAATIRENIAYGDLAADSARIEQAARDAGALEFITSLPGGLDTRIGEGGRGLSGGERQRIAIARAFLRDAPILILDEPTSAVDSRTEAAILDALDRLMEGRTTFIIAHRLSTIRHADRILVLERGRIVERGTHTELLSHAGLYRKLHDLQAGEVRQPSRRGGSAGDLVSTPIVAIAG